MELSGHIVRHNKWFMTGWRLVGQALIIYDVITEGVLPISS